MKTNQPMSLIAWSASRSRPDRKVAAEIVPFIPQALAIGVAVLQDASPTPIYPR